MSNQTTWAGTPTQLFGELGRFSADHGLASMPRSAHALTMALNRNRPALRSIGLDIESGRTAHQRLTKINRRIEFEEFAKEIALPLDRKWIMGPGQGTSLDEMEMQAPGNENQGQSNTSSVHSVSVKNT